MLISGVIKLIKKVFDGFTTLVVLLLVKAGMWLPAVFSLVFIIICLAFSISFAGFTTGVFVTGLIVTAIIGGVLAFRNNRKLKRAVPPKNKVRYLEKAHSKSINKIVDYSTGEWDNGSSLQNGQLVADEDKVGRYNQEYAYKNPDPINELHSNVLTNNQPPIYNNDSTLNNGNPQNTKNGANNPPVYDRYINPNQVQNGYNNINQEYGKPNQGQAGYRSLNQENVKYDDFNELRERYFGQDGKAKPSNECAATMNNPNQQQYREYSDNRFNNQDLNNRGFYQNSSNSFSEQKFYPQQSSPNTDFYNEKPVDRKSPFDKFFEKNESYTSPMVFATRRDPNLLIHEYPDRLEFYKKTATGLVLVSVEHKN